MSTARGFVLDHTVLLALGAGNRLASGLIVASHEHADVHVYVPALCLAAGQSGRPGLGEHILSLPAVQLEDLGFADACAVGDLIHTGMDWQAAHALVVAHPKLGQPDPVWPVGRRIVTQVAEWYAGWGLQVIQLPIE